MLRCTRRIVLLAAGLIGSALALPCPAQTDAPLPAGVRAEWSLDKAWREATPTRERVCLNGLWRWQPAAEAAGAAAVPAGNWGWFKVPGAWPGITDYVQKDCQTVHAHPSWKDVKMGQVAAAWYQREFTVPADWAGPGGASRRITFAAECLNSHASVYVDGKPAGEIRFPAGEADLTALCRPGAKHTLSLLVTALPLKAVMTSFRDTATAKEVKGSVQRRGLCGDVYLVGAPAGPRLVDVRAETALKRGEITLSVGLEGLADDVPFTFRTRIADAGRTVAEFNTKPQRVAGMKEGRIAFTLPWKPEKLWDLHTPQNGYTAEVAMLGAGNKVLDAAAPVRFGGREFRIEGRDFFLNGSRIFLSAVPLDNAQLGAAWASYEGAKETLLRLKSIGINFVYTHNYGCEPGSHLAFEEILRAADDVGMLVGLSQPHFSHYDWKAPDADASNGYAAHAAYYVRVAGSHPSVVCYSTSHNACGYAGDMDPNLIDGLYERTDSWSANNAKLALRAEAIIRRLDPGRIVYHHAGGNIGTMHTINFYPNFVPIQEMCDWFEHWATKGTKPVFLVEYGAPFTWDWAMYRGWYRDKREFGSAQVPWEYCFAEWNAQFLGDRAYRIGEPEKANVRYEAKQFAAGNFWWRRWSTPHELDSKAFDDRHAVIAMYTDANWRAFRTWGLSANSPWQHGHFWRLRDGIDTKTRKDLPVDWDRLQRPGFSPDYLAQRYEKLEAAFERADWVPTPDGEALLRNNQPLLAYIGGKPARFTSKDHNVRPGEAVEKQLIIINNSRVPVTCDCSWSLALPQAVKGTKQMTVPTGDQVRLPLKFDLPASLPAGTYELSATVRFSTGETQKDTFALHVLPTAPAAGPIGKVALFDPKGETAKWLTARRVPFQAVEAGANLAPFDVLIVGRAALTVDGPGPDVSRVRDGLKVIVFEQTCDVLEKRFGFRATEYGLRNAFKRVPDHPLLAGLETENLRDWCGEATLVPPTRELPLRPKYGPSIKWCDIDVTRVWRAGCRGNVASVLIEKPARGDFLPILDGGYSLQYSPLMEVREGKGMVLFCQLDVTGRSEADPAAERIVSNLLTYAAAWKPTPRRTAVYAGDPAGKQHLEKAGVAVADFASAKLSADQVLVIGPGATKALAGKEADVAAWIKAGGRAVAIGLDEAGAAMLPVKVTLKKTEHIAAVFEPFPAASPLAGICPADVHNRDPRQIPLIVGGATAYGDGVLAQAEGVAFCQMAPWAFEGKTSNLRRTYRRASFAAGRALANAGVAGTTPILERFSTPVAADKPEKRWQDGLYLDLPEEWDDPYRFFRW